MGSRGPVPRAGKWVTIALIPINFLQVIWKMVFVTLERSYLLWSDEHQLRAKLGYGQ